MRSLCSITWWIPFHTTSGFHLQLFLFTLLVCTLLLNHRLSDHIYIWQWWVHCFLSLYPLCEDVWGLAWEGFTHGKKMLCLCTGIRFLFRVNKHRQPCIFAGRLSIFCLYIVTVERIAARLLSICKNARRSILTSVLLTVPHAKCLNCMNYLIGFLDQRKMYFNMDLILDFLFIKMVKPCFHDSSCITNKCLYFTKTCTHTCAQCVDFRRKDSHHEKNRFLFPHLGYIVLLEFKWQQL